MRRALIAATGLALVAAAALPAQPSQDREVLRFDRETMGRIGANNEAKLYRINVREPGAMTLVATSIIDIAIAVLDDEGQIVLGGYLDRDYLGDVGKEYGLIVLGSRGEYTIEVRGVGEDESGGEFAILAAFVADPMFGRAPDADGKPSGAREIGIGEGIDDTMTPNRSDRIDWYTFTAEEAGTYVIATRADPALKHDLLLNVFVGDALLDHPTASSDEDLRNNVANESVTVEVKAGERVRYRVLAINERGEAMAYRTSVARVP